MKAIHPDIVGRRLTHPQGADETFDHFLDGFTEPRHELLNELSDGIGTDHKRATPVYSSGEEPAYLLELTRFIVVYQLLPNTVEVFTIVSKRNPHQPEYCCSFTANATASDEPTAYSHPDIADKEITYVNLDSSFPHFAQEACASLNPNQLISELEDAIRLSHGEAKAIPLSGHPRPIWELQTPHLRFQYQVLDGKVEVGTMWSRSTGVSYEPGQDLLAEYTK